MPLIPKESIDMEDDKANRIYAVIFDIGNVLIKWKPERFCDEEIGEEKRKAMFSEVDLHEMNRQVDEGARGTCVCSHQFRLESFAYAESITLFCAISTVVTSQVRCALSSLALPSLRWLKKILDFRLNHCSSSMTGPTILSPLAHAAGKLIFLKAQGFGGLTRERRASDFG